jgi:hypothetical protein
MGDKVLFDRVGWRDAKGETHFTQRGEDIPDAMPAEEKARLKELGAIGPEKDLKPAEAAPGASDDEIREMNIDQVAAHLAQHPGDADRIEALEMERDSPRKGVTDLLETHRQALGG